MKDTGAQKRSTIRGDDSGRGKDNANYTERRLKNDLLIKVRRT